VSKSSLSQSPVIGFHPAPGGPKPKTRSAAPPEFEPPAAPVDELPEGARTAKGRALVNLLPLREGESVRAVIATRDFTEDKYLVFGTKRLKNVGQDLGEAVKGFKKGMSEEEKREHLTDEARRDETVRDNADPVAKAREDDRNPPVGR